jgi:3-oxoacyl-[acyl-carrier-protein] synthase III
MRTAEITGWGKCMPPNVLSNHDLEQLVDTSDEWITTGPGSRSVASATSKPPTGRGGMHAGAGRGRQDARGRRPPPGRHLPPDSIIPSTASIVQKRLGAWNCGGHGPQRGLLGFRLRHGGGHQHDPGRHQPTVLLVGTRKLHHLMDFTDRTTCVLFGDGAGAVVLEPTDGPAGVLPPTSGWTDR